MYTDVRDCKGLITSLKISDKYPLMVVSSLFKKHLSIDEQLEEQLHGLSPVTQICHAVDQLSWLFSNHFLF